MNSSDKVDISYSDYIVLRDLGLPVSLKDRGLLQNYTTLLWAWKLYCLYNYKPFNIKDFVQDESRINALKVFIASSPRNSTFLGIKDFIEAITDD